MRLIDADAAIDALCAVCGKACDKSEFVYNAPQDEQVILCPEHYCLCTLPSVQPMRKEAKWMTAYLDYESMGHRPKILYCSRCNQCIAYPTNFCPNCGARMVTE